MKTCGILISKAISKRFPGKNQLLFKKNAELLIQYCGVDNVYMFTDCPEIKEKCKFDLGIQIIRKAKNFNDEFSYLDALKYAYYSINTKYDIIVTIQCDSIGHTLFAIEDGIKLIEKDDHITEVRGFNSRDKQSGLFIFKADKLPEKWHHMGSVLDLGREIHYKDEL